MGQGALNFECELCREENGFPEPSQGPWLGLKIKLIETDWQEKNMQIYLIYILRDMGAFTRKLRSEEKLDLSMSMQGLIKSGQLWRNMIG